MDASQIEFGIDSFGDLPRTDQGAIVSHAEAIRAAVTEAVLADEIGIDVVALGEHHLPEFAISSPETVLAGIATVTKRIRLASAETVASKIAHAARVLDAGRFDLIYSSAGTVSASARLRAVELYGTEVIPRVRELLAEQPAAGAGATR
ncbi:LLM class flavin-dependent oxidoreductase [Streptomyces globisporus]|nr:LLM class flavin-dependent oxidoreductase [Streptomyces globisporus]